MKILYRLHQYCQQRQREKRRWIWPVHMAMEATYYRDQGHHIYWDEPEYNVGADRVIAEPEGISFLNLPHPDRYLTKAFDPKYQANGNYKYNPGTYIQSATGCWWGNCVFCKENGHECAVRPVDDVIKEIQECKDMRFKEIFDDAASLAAGKWRKDFIEELGKIDTVFSCNMRFDTKPNFKRMKKAGFRMLLYGLESGNQETLDKINKGINIKKAIKELRLAARAGLEPHVAVMFGYPWELHEDAVQTLKLVHWLLRKGYAKTAQASLYTPIKQDLFNQMDKHYIPKIYRAAFHPEFWITRIREIKNKEDLKYLWKGIKSCFGK